MPDLPLEMLSKKPERTDAALGVRLPETMRLTLNNSSAASDGWTPGKQVT